MRWLVTHHEWPCDCSDIKGSDTNQFDLQDFKSILDLADLRFIFAFTLYFIVFINIFRQSTMTVYINLQKFTKLAAIFMICDLKSKESTMRFEIMSDPSSDMQIKA